jgi:two-component system CheB/CheR fusion protein
MPRSAEDTGLVDFVLPPAEMPRQLIQYFKHPASLDKEKKALEEGQLPMVLRKIITVLGNRTGHDFSTYKKSTLVRRIERRMSVKKIEYASQYLDHLHRNPSEVETLFQELLIGVTSFFRDPEAFDYLKDEVLPDLLTATDHDHAFRVWAPGCATGEEVYSIAIILQECMERLSFKREIQIFGTDIDKFAVEKAREGVYPQNIAVDVTKERLERFFTKEGDLYKVRKDIREGAVFAVQNILKDPPFSNLDLLVCRNLLIYLEPKAQKKLMPLFHYTLKPEGVLFLGTSESVGGFTDLFTPLSKKWSLYRKRDINVAVRPIIEFPTRSWTYQPSQDQLEMAAQIESAGEAGIALAVERLLLRRYTPSCVIVDRKGEIRYIHGRTSRYLELAQGRPEFHILSMAREGLRFPLASAMRQAVTSNEEVVRDGLRVESDSGVQTVKLTIKPLHTPESLKGLVLVLFEDSPPVPEPAESTCQADDGSEKQRALDLERELARTQQDYRSALEELETSNEELKSVNEEIQSANEELQSTNEELESSREELQSLNEELTTVNAELHEKIVELSDAYSTITDVLNSTRVAILVLDNDLLVRRFTTEARNVINLIEADIGRPISDISTNLDYDGLDQDFRNVIESLAPKEKEVRTKDGHWHLMRIIPYRTKDNRLDGVVVTFINIDAQKDAQTRVEQLSKDAVLSAMRYAENIVDTVRESLLVLDTDFRVISANRSFYDSFRVSAEETEGKSIFELGDRQWNIPRLRELLERISGVHSSFEDFEVEHTFPRVGHKIMLLNARRLRMESEGTEKILLAIEDVTEIRKKDEA